MGTAAGLLAGAFSESTVIGTAGEAINRLAIPTEEKTRLINNIPIAYAVTYLIGTAGLVWFLPVIGPKLMGINLKEEGRRARAKTVGAAELEPGITSAARRYDVRAYRVSNQFLAKRTIGEIEAMPKDARVFILRIRRQGQIVEPQPSTVILEDDVIAVATRRAVLVEHGAKIGPEVEDHALLDIPVEMLDVVVTNRTLAGQTVAELARHEVARGVFLQKLVRAGEEMPVVPEMTIDRGDVMSLVGPRPEVERAAKELGYPDWPTNTTDMIFVGTGIVLGGARRPPLDHDCRAAAHPHRQRRRSRHGARVRVAAFRETAHRPHTRTSDLDLRHRRALRLHRCGGPERWPGVRRWASDNRDQPRRRGPGVRPDSSHRGDSFRAVRAQNESAHPPGGMRRGGNDHGRAPGHPG